MSWQLGILGASGGGLSGFSPLGAQLDVLFRENIAVINGVPQTIAGTTTPQNWPVAGTFTRNSAADWLNPAGGGLEAQAAANVLRRGPVRGALFEGAFTNHVARSDFNGALTTAEAGNATGTPPSGQGGLGTASGTTLAITGRGTENGMPYIDLNLVGTATTTGGRQYAFVANADVVAAVGQVWTGSLSARLVGGTTTGISSLGVRIQERNTGGTVAGSQTTNNFLPSLTSSSQLFSHTRTVADASTDRVQAQFVYVPNNGATIDITVRIYIPNLIQSGAASSPIITTSGPATRLADVLSLPVSLSGNFTAVAIARMPSAPDNNTDALFNIAVDQNNRYTLRRNTVNLLAWLPVVGGTGQSVTTVNAPAAGQRFAIAVRRSGANTGISINGGAPANAAPASFPDAPTTLFAGCIPNGSAQWNDFIERVIVFPTAVNDATLQQYSTLATWGG